VRNRDGVVVWVYDGSTAESLPISVDELLNRDKVFFSDDGRLMLLTAVNSPGSGGSGRVFDLENRRLVSELQGYEPQASFAVFSRGGERLVTHGPNGMTNVWDVRSGELCLSAEEGASYAYWAEFSPDGLLAFSSSWHPEGDSGRWATRILQVEPDSTRTGIPPQLALPQPVEGGGRQVDWAQMSGIRFFADDRRFFTFHARAGVCMWDMDSFDLLACFTGPVGHYDDPTSVVSPDGRHVLTFGLETRLWNVASKEVVATFQLGTPQLRPPAFSPDGCRILERRAGSSAEPAVLRIWDADTGECLARLPSPLRFAQASFSRDGCTVLMCATGSEGDASSQVVIWQRRRPERWWGVFWLPAFWLTLVLLVALSWSLCRDGRRWLRRSATQPNASSSPTGSEAAP
jgi:WD40 repeat protein